MKKMIFLCMVLYSMQTHPTVIGSDEGVGRQARAFFKKIDSFNNKMKGFSIFQKGFTLENPNTIVAFDAFFPVSGDVVLNGGTLDLVGDIVFKNPFRIGVGCINGNGHTVELPNNVSVLDFPSVYYIKLFVNLVDMLSVGHDVYGIHWSHDDAY